MGNMSPYYFKTIYRLCVKYIPSFIKIGGAVSEKNGDNRQTFVVLYFDTYFNGCRKECNFLSGFLPQHTTTPFYLKMDLKVVTSSQLTTSWLLKGFSHRSSKPELFEKWVTVIAGSKLRCCCGLSSTSLVPDAAKEKK